MSFLFAMMFIGIGIYLFERSIRLRTKGQAAMGTIAQIKHTYRSNAIIIQFEISKNHKVKFEVDGTIFAFVLHQAGDSVPVLYNPQKPEDAIINTWDIMWLHPVVFIGFGSFFLYQAFIGR